MNTKPYAVQVCNAGDWPERLPEVKPSGTVRQGRRPMFKPFPKDDDDTCPKCGSSVCTHIWELDVRHNKDCPACKPNEVIDEACDSQGVHWQQGTDREWKATGYCCANCLEIDQRMKGDSL